MAIPPQLLGLLGLGGLGGLGGAGGPGGLGIPPPQIASAGAETGTLPGASPAPRPIQIAPNPDDDEEGKRWDQRIDDALARWDRERDVRERYVQLYRKGVFPPRDDGWTEGANVNLCFSYVSIITALLAANLPVIEVDPRRGNVDEAFAEALEKWQTYAVEESETEIVNAVTVFDAILRGISWTKESFDPKRGMDVADALTCLEVHVDPLARYSLSQARFVIQRVVKPIHEAREFFNDDSIEPNYRLIEEKGLPAERARDLKQGNDKDLLKFYEIWSKENGQRLLAYRVRNDDSPQGSSWLGQTEWPYKLDGDDFPFSSLVFNTTYSGVDGFSEQEVADGLQREVNELAEFDRRHTRRAAAGKVLYDRAAFNQDGVQDLESPETLKFIGADLRDKKIDDVLKLVDFNTSTDRQKAVYERAKQLHDEVLGFDELQRGIMNKGVTATQSEIADEFAKLRIGKRQNAVDTWLKRSLRHRAQIARLHVDPRTVAEAVSPQAGMAWASYAGNESDLVREYSIRIRAGSTGERAKRARLQQAQDNLVLFTNVNSALIAQGQPPAWDIVEAGLEVLRAREERNPERYLLPPPAPPAVPEPVGQPMPATVGGPPA